jgi:hypothetical protein
VSTIALPPLPARAGPHRPVGLRVLMLFGALFAAGTPVLLSLAALGVGEFRIGPRVVDAATWLRVAAPLFALAGLLFAATSYGIARRRAWSRRPLLALWPAIAAYAAAGFALGAVRRPELLQALADAAVLGAASYWYLYRKRNVRAYFQALRTRP